MPEGKKPEVVVGLEKQKMGRMKSILKRSLTLKALTDDTQVEAEATRMEQKAIE